jgi:hypothetical protein
VLLVLGVADGNGAQAFPGHFRQNDPTILPPLWSPVAHLARAPDPIKWGPVAIRIDCFAALLGISRPLYGQALGLGPVRQRILKSFALRAICSGVFGGYSSHWDSNHGNWAKTSRAAAISGEW